MDEREYVARPVVLAKISELKGTLNDKRAQKLLGAIHANVQFYVGVETILAQMQTAKQYLTTANKRGNEIYNQLLEDIKKL